MTTVQKNITQRLFGRTVIDSMDLNQNAWYIDEVQVTATAAQINTAGDNTRFHSVLAAGTAKDTTVTITGMLATSTIVSVFLVDFTGGAITDVTSEYTAAAGSMTKVGPDETGKTLMITWISA
jgi:hypothetical protein